MAKTKPKRAIIQFAWDTPSPALAARRVHQLHILSLQERVEWVCCRLGLGASRSWMNSCFIFSGRLEDQTETPREFEEISATRSELGNRLDQRSPNHRPERMTDCDGPRGSRWVHRLVTVTQGRCVALARSRK